MGNSLLQAFLDDSTDPSGTYVLAGFIASEERWAAFSKDWSRLLIGRHGVLKGNTDRYHFKMAEMAAETERIARVPAFFKLIEEYALLGICCCLNSNDLRAARERIFVSDVEIDWGLWTNTYMVAFRCLLDTFHNKRSTYADIIPDGAKVQFTFDAQQEANFVRSSWADYILARRDSVRESYASTPLFKDDEEVLPLQAADLWAWWVRKARSEGRLSDLMEGKYETFPHPGNIPNLVIEFDEDALTKDLMSVARENVGPDRTIIDFRIGAVEL